VRKIPRLVALFEGVTRRPRDTQMHHREKPRKRMYMVACFSGIYVSPRIEE
jgi:hypothetical protein